MRLADVCGQVVATRKDGRLAGVRLLLVQPVDEQGRPAGCQARGTNFYGRFTPEDSQSRRQGRRIGEYQRGGQACRQTSASAAVRRTRWCN